MVISVCVESGHNLQLFSLFCSQKQNPNGYTAFQLQRKVANGKLEFKSKFCACVDDSFPKLCHCKKNEKKVRKKMNVNHLDCFTNKIINLKTTATSMYLSK